MHRNKQPVENKYFHVLVSHFLKLLISLILPLFLYYKQNKKDEIVSVQFSDYNFADTKQPLSSSFLSNIDSPSPYTKTREGIPACVGTVDSGTQLRFNFSCLVMPPLPLNPQILQNSSLHSSSIF